MSTCSPGWDSPTSPTDRGWTSLPWALTTNLKLSTSNPFIIKFFRDDKIEVGKANIFPKERKILKEGFPGHDQRFVKFINDDKIKTLLLLERPQLTNGAFTHLDVKTPKQPLNANIKWTVASFEEENLLQDGKDDAFVLARESWEIKVGPPVQKDPVREIEGHDQHQVESPRLKLHKGPHFVIALS